MRTSTILYLLFPVLGILFGILGIPLLAWFFLWAAWGSAGTYIYLRGINPHVITSKDINDILAVGSVIFISCLMAIFIGPFGVLFGGISLLIQQNERSRAIA